MILVNSQPFHKYSGIHIFKPVREKKCGSDFLEVKKFVDQSQSPIFLRDPQDRALVTVNGSHLDFKCTESNLGKSIKST